ncbi:response regulator [Oceanicoccus sagamiensis]|uniref:DNA-binding response regulator n=1 Tax=Oceanicoccus sagamiensis TaxID=716816 RepID=A0A1X9NNP2_9GAMM|nr:response regulator transcription factor [Oceanicoccus sagamiensis]ARN75513.1 hypothetical protein BST96_16195 [Oceanicoccus sagamiensis]
MNKSNPVNVLVGDDHQVIFQGIETMLNNHSIINDLDYAASIDEISSRLSENKYDLLLLDLNINGINSLDHVEAFRGIIEDLKIIIFSSYNNKKLIDKASDLNTNGYLLKNTDQDSFQSAIEKVINGGTVFDQELKITDSPSDDIEQYANLEELSKREKELAALIIAGNNEQEIADLLFISKNTVRTHKKNIFRKLNVSGTFGLIKYIQANNEVF